MEQHPMSSSISTQPQKRMFRIPPRMGMFAFIFFAVVMMGLRLQDVTTDIAQGKPPQAIAPAQAASTGNEADKPAMHESKKEDAEPMMAKEGDAAKDAMKDEKPDAINTDPVIEGDRENFSDAEVNILKRLSERRQELDKRARDVDQREALLKITEQRIDKKLSEMKTIQEELRKTVSTASAEQKAKTESLVKIYEIMKPKDAAAIFNALDMPVLLSVMANMKEARVAPILAAMDPQKAKLVTSALIEKKPLPVVP